MKIKKNDLIMQTYCYAKVDWYVVTDIDTKNKSIYVKNITDLMNMKYKLVIDSNEQERKKERLHNALF